MGLFGTLVGMIEIFGTNSPGNSNPEQLAHGISVALYNAAFGILVAIPSMIFYRYFHAKVDALVIEMELQALKLVEIVHGEGRTDSGTRDRDKQTSQLEPAHVFKAFSSGILLLFRENRSNDNEFHVAGKKKIRKSTWCR